MTGPAGKLLDRVLQRPEQRLCVDVSARLADQYSRRRKAADARKLAEAVLAKEPGHVQASIVKARLLASAGDEEAAQKILDEAIKMNNTEDLDGSGTFNLVGENTNPTVTPVVIDQGGAIWNPTVVNVFPLEIKEP